MSEWESIIGSNKASSYGSCVRSAERSTAHYIKYFLEKSDTLQGIALKYNTSTEELRRINKLYSSDNIFIRKFLLVPAPLTCSASDTENTVLPQPEQLQSQCEPPKEIDAFSFLQQLDTKISAGKKAVKDYKQQDINYNISDSAEPKNTAQYLKPKEYFKSDPATIFSHSQTSESEQLFQL